MITITGKATLHDYLDAQIVRLLPRYLIGVFTYSAAAVFAYELTYDYSYSTFYSAFFVLCGLVIRPMIWRARLKRTWEGTPSNSLSYTIGIDDSGFHSTDEAGNSVVNHWDMFIKFKESKRTFFLYLSPNLYRFVPKRLMSQEDQEALRQLVKAHIQRH